MREKLFCHLCDEAIEFYITDETFDYPVKNERFNIKGKRAFCKIHAEELFHQEFDRENQQKAFDMYREANGLVMVDEIKETREKYNLTQREYSYLLGFGEITISRYERGSLPTKAQSQLIEESKRPEQMQRLLKENSDKISQEKAEKLYNILHKTSTENIYEEMIIQEIRDVFHHESTIFTGQAMFSFQKFSNMVTYFAKKQEPYITKLNKLLFYADFLHFKHYKVSISGAIYNRLHYGPVPERYNTLFESITNIEMEENDFGIKAIAVQDVGEGAFIESELFILQMVSNQFKPMNAKQIADYSHQEKCWLEVEHNAKIPYSYAELISFED